MIFPTQFIVDLAIEQNQISNENDIKYININTTGYVFNEKTRQID